MNLNLKIYGLERVIKRIKEITNNIKKGVPKSLSDTGRMVVNLAKDYTPEKNGTLKSDLDYNIDQNTVSIGVTRGKESFNYASFIHYGNYKEGEKTKMRTGAGRLFITRAIEELRGEIINNFKKNIRF